MHDSVKTPVTNVQGELLILDLEREILSDIIRRLFGAEADKRITATERQKLAASYNAKMMSIKESIAKDEKAVVLHDLESMQEDLMKLFSKRFDEIKPKVEELRSLVKGEKKTSPDISNGSSYTDKLVCGMG